MHERHVVNLPLAKRLKEAGFPQETEFWWWWGSDGACLDPMLIAYRAVPSVLNGCAAPLASEVAEKLPEAACVIHRNNAGWNAMAPGGLGKTFADVPVFHQFTMPDALAALWLALNEVKS